MPWNDAQRRKRGDLVEARQSGNRAGDLQHARLAINVHQVAGEQHLLSRQPHERVSRRVSAAASLVLKAHDAPLLQHFRADAATIGSALGRERRL